MCRIELVTVTQKILLTTLALILNWCDSTVLSPVNRQRDTGNLLVPERPITAPLPSEHPMMLNLGASIRTPELVVGHVCKLVQFQLIRLVFFVAVVDMLDILLEHIEPLVLLIKAPRNRVVAPPPLVQIPQAVLRGQVSLMVIKALSHPNHQSK